jgi:hypothetical protein
MIFANESDGFVQQDVGARLDYAEDWTEFMALAPTDTIQASNWTSVPNGLIFEDGQIDGRLLQHLHSRRHRRAGLPGPEHHQTAQGRTDVRSFILLVQDSAVAPDVVLQTALFDRFNSVADFKKSSLAFLDDSFPVDNLTDSVVWDNMVAAEAEASHQLRVFLQPTVILPTARSRTSGTRWSRRARLTPSRTITTSTRAIGIRPRGASCSCGRRRFARSSRCACPIRRRTTRS